MTKFEGTNRQTTGSVTPTHESPTPLPAQQSASLDRGQEAGCDPAPARAHVSFSDPGDGYDSAIRWHGELERGNL